MERFFDAPPTIDAEVDAALANDDDDVDVGTMFARTTVSRKIRHAKRNESSRKKPRAAAAVYRRARLRRRDELT